MTQPERDSRAGAAVPGLEHGATAAAEVKTALGGLMTDLSDFRAGITKQLKAQEERLTMLDRKSAYAARPHLSAAADLDAPHQKAFEGYLRSGDDEALRGLDIEQKALAYDGGVLVDPVTAETVRMSLRSTASIRSIATVVTVEATSYDVLIDRAELGHRWVNETSNLTDTTGPVVERISIPLHELSALPKASQRLLDDAAFDIDTWLAGRIAEKFARAEAEAFVEGDGVDKPRGFLSHPKESEMGGDSAAWGNLGYIATGAAGDFNGSNASDSIIELVYALGARYRANATFVMSSKTAGAVRKMKDSDGRFLWTDNLAAGEPARLMGYPVLVTEHMPEIAPGSFSVAFGDFEAGYTVAERPDLRVLRDPFSAKPHVLFYATKRVGGDVSDFAAIKLLKFATS